MPFVGLGLHVILAIFFAVHAVRTGREIYWLAILFGFPLLGSAVYFAAVFVPHSRLERSAIKAGAVIQKGLNPGRGLRDAQRAFDLAPSADNQMRLAAALLDAGQMPEALGQYEACLRGPFAGAPEIGFGAARAQLANDRPHEAIHTLLALRERHPAFRPQHVGLLLAAAYDSAGRDYDAGAQYQQLVTRFASIEARAHLAIWAIARGNRALAERELNEIRHTRRHMNRYARGLHQDLFKRLDDARATLN